jgi:thymidylate kinase
MTRENDILLQAAHLSNPWPRSGDTTVSVTDADSITAILRDNSVSFMTLHRSGAFRTGAHAAFETALEAETRLHSVLRDEYLRIQREFEKRDIDSLFIKASGLAPSFPHLSSNLDVLVKRERGDDARELLHQLGYAELTNTEEPNKFLFRRFTGEGFSYTFHLHEAVGWGVPFVDTQAIWDNARTAEDDPAVKIPGAEEALLITLAHWFYEDKKLSLANLFHTAAALRDASGSIPACAESAGARGWKIGFFCALHIFNETWRRLYGRDAFEPHDRREVESFVRSSGPITRYILSKVRYLDGCPARIPFLTSKLIYYLKIISDPARRVRARLGDVAKTLLWAVRWKLHIRSQKRILVTMSGCDGSGKTVQIEKLAAVFDQCDLRSTILWARGGSSPFVSFFTRLAKSLRGGAGPSGAGTGEAEKVRYRTAALGNPLLRFSYSLLYALDLFWIYAVRTRIAGLNGSIVICDRYIADALVDFAVSSGGSVRRLPFALTLLEALAPSPDCNVLLDVEAEEALRRKPEEGGAEHLKRAGEQFLDYARDRDMWVVDGEQSIGEIHESIVRRSLAIFYKRFSTAGNMLLYSNPGQINRGRWRP